MHRSGTSAFTGVVEGLGVRLKGRLADGHARINEKGYKEDIALIDLHEDLLWSYPSSWDDIFLLDLGEYTGSQKTVAKNRFRQILLEYFRTDLCCGLKDPRVCLFLPLWLEVCREERIDVYFLLPFRDPASVARSLKARDGILTGRSMILWAKYILTAERFSRGYPRLLLSYEELISNPVESATLILEQLSLTGEDDRDNQISRGAEFVTASLNHSNESNGDHEIVPEFVRELYQLLKEHDRTNVGAGTQKCIDEIAVQYRTFMEKSDPILLDQIRSYRNHAGKFRTYWQDALGSRTLRFARQIRRLLGL